MASAGSPAVRPRIHSRYADGTAVLEGRQPPRVAGPDAAAKGRPIP
jgi:hypothetical protein